MLFFCRSRLVLRTTRLASLSLVLALLLNVFNFSIMSLSANGLAVIQTTFESVTNNTVVFSLQANQNVTTTMTLVNNVTGYTIRQSDTNSSLLHSFNFNPLSSGTTYSYQFTTTNASGNYVSPPATVTTAQAVNTFYFTNLMINSDGNPVTIGWSTNTAATSSVDYGLDTNYGLTANGADSYTNHVVPLGSLAAGTLYHYRIKDTNGGGIQLISPDMTFTTPGTPTPTTTASITTATTTTSVTTATTVSTTAGTLTPTTSTTGTVPTTASSTPSPTTTTPTISPTTPGISPTTAGTGGAILVVDRLQLNFSGSSSEVSDGLASQSLKITSTAPAQWWLQSFTNSGGDWLAANPTSGILGLSGDGSQYLSGVTLTVRALNLTPGNYNGGIFINNSSNPSQPALIVAVALTVIGSNGTPTTATPTPPPTTIAPASGFTYYLPFLSNGANGFTTYLTLQNQGTDKANVAISYFDNLGQTAGLLASSTIGAGAQWNPANSFIAGTSGSGQIVSSQPLNIVVSEATPTGGSAFLLNKVTANRLVAPLVSRQAYGGFSTVLYLMNAGRQPTSIKVTYYAPDGSVVKTQTVNLAAHGSGSLDQSDAVLNLPNEFIGWAALDAGANGSICAQVLESNPILGFTATFGTVAAPFVNPNTAQTSSVGSHTSGAGTTLYAPAIFNGAYGSFYTGMTLVNANAAPANVSVNYYDPSQGNIILTQKFSLNAYAVRPIFHGDPNLGLPAHFYGSATISSDQPLAGVVNENGGGATSGTYNLLTAGGQRIYLPVLANGAYGGYVSGLTILNLTAAPITFSLQYYDSQGNNVGVVRRYSLAAHGSQPVYQKGDSEQLPPGFFGTAQVLVDAPGSVAVTTNVANSQFFYTYTSP